MFKCCICLEIKPVEYVQFYRLTKQKPEDLVNPNPDEVTYSFDEVKKSSDGDRTICIACVAQLKFAGMMNLLDAALDTSQELSGSDKPVQEMTVQELIEHNEKKLKD